MHEVFNAHVGDDPVDVGNNKNFVTAKHVPLGLSHSSEIDVTIT